jgi:protein TonB
MAELAHPPGIRRAIVVAAGVVLFHAAGLWALQAGLLQRAIETVVPAEMLSEFIEPPRPQVEPPTPPATRPPPPVARKVELALPSPPAPVALAAPAVSPNAPTGVAEAQAPAPPIATPVAADPQPVAPPSPPKVELPSSDADYLHNPKPAYPPLSKRAGEQGQVVVRVLIGVDGTAQKAEVHQSSGFDRLDRAALETAQRWRYVPGKRGGVPEAMWFNVPIKFVLE